MIERRYDQEAGQAKEFYGDAGDSEVDGMAAEAEEGTGGEEEEGQEAVYADAGFAPGG